MQNQNTLAVVTSNRNGWGELHRTDDPNKFEFYYQTSDKKGWFPIDLQNQMLTKSYLDQLVSTVEHAYNKCADMFNRRRTQIMGLAK